MGGGSVHIRMLGGFEVRTGQGAPLTFTTRKAEAMLAVLALEPGRAVARSKLCGLLWPNVADAQARHSLSQALVSLRKLLPSAISASARTLALCNQGAQVDTQELARWLELGTREALSRVALAYRGELLDGLVIEEAPFEHWLYLERERVRAAVTHGLSCLVEMHTAAGALSDALQVSKQVLQLDPLREAAHRSCMRLLQQLGRRTEALRHYRELTRTLRATLEAAPERETQQLGAELERVSSVRAAPPRQAVLALASQPAAIPNLARDAELAQLQAARERTRHGGAELCLVVGEAGVGKSHLCSQLTQALRDREVRELRGRCFESEQVLPFACWSELLRAAGLADDVTALARLPAELRRELARLVPELHESPSPRAAEDPSAMFQALACVLSGWAQSAPLCVVLEDLHWADEMSLRFLCYLTRRQQGPHGCMIVATARSELSDAARFLPVALAELEREGRLQRVPLEPFDYASTCRLAALWTAQLSLELPGPAWLQRVWRLSEGNALVVVESVRALAQHTDAADLERLSVPERVRALIRRRLGALSPHAREVAALAAVYGRELEPALLASLMGQAEWLLALEELATAQLLRVQAERISFSHDRVRETLYEELLPARRRALHGRIAAGLALQATGSTLGQAGYHYAKAGEAEAAVALLMRFSEHATRTHAVGDALAALEEASQQLQSLPPARRGRMRVALAVRQASCLVLLGRFGDMVEQLQRCSELPDDDLPLIASYHYWQGFALTFLGRAADAQAHAARARAYAVRCNDKRLCGYVDNLTSHLCNLTGQFIQGLSHAERALETLRACDDVEPFIYAHMNLCLHQLALSQWNNALATATRAEHQAQSRESERARSLAALVSGMVHACLYRWDLAQRAAHAAMATSKTPFTLAPACALLALTQLATGRCHEAVELLEQMLGQMHGEKPQTLHIPFLILYAEALLRAGSLRRAQQVAAEAAHNARETGNVSLGMALRVQGLAEHRLGETPHARRHLSAALHYYETVELALGEVAVLLAMAELELDSDGAADARARLTRAHARCVAIAHEPGVRDIAQRLTSLELAKKDGATPR